MIIAQVAFALIAESISAKEHFKLQLKTIHRGRLPATRGVAQIRPPPA
ncbi:MAG: hypothetical protein AAGC73_04660 [Verrucomicrobiota bacterium]